MCSDIRVDDFGTVFRATIKDQDDRVVNVSGSIQTLLKFKNPEGTLYTKPASVWSDGSSGIIEYTIESGLLDTGGRWEMQGYVQTSTGQWHTSIVNFFVQDNLE